MPLPDLVGVVDFPTSGPGKEAYFNFDQQFSEIHDVWIELDAYVVAREFDVCGTMFDPQPCVHVVQLLGFFARLDKEDSPVLGTVFSDGLTFSDSTGDPEGCGVDVAQFTNRQIGWDFLLDGEGSLELFWNRLLGNPDRIIRNRIDPSGEIFAARLIVDATPAPEPTSSLLQASALVLVVGLRKRVRRLTRCTYSSAWLRETTSIPKEIQIT